MGQMNKEKAFEILELNPGATKDEVSKRYGILTKKFKSMEKDERGYTLDDITRAYNLLMGITYIDKEEEARQKALREHPPLLARILKVDPVKLENFFHYYKLYILVSIALVIFLIFSIRSCMNQVKPDFTIVCFGKVYCQDQTSAQNSVKERLPEIQAPSVQFLSSIPDDAQYEYATQMKFVAMIAAKEIDLVIMDRENFDMYVAQGMFIPLDARLSELGFPEESLVEGQEIVDETDDSEPVYGPSYVYGIDITGNEFLTENGIYADSAVVGIIGNTDNTDKAFEFIRTLKN